MLLWRRRYTTCRTLQGCYRTNARIVPSETVNLSVCWFSQDGNMVKVVHPVVTEEEGTSDQAYEQLSEVVRSLIDI